MNLKPERLKKKKKNSLQGVKRGEVAEIAYAKALRQKDGNMLKSLKERHCGS